MEEVETLKLDNTGEDDEEFIPFKYAISSSRTDYPVDSLVSRMNNGSTYVPKFQRGYVWKIERASRLIESLLLGLPVPMIFLAKEKDTQRLLVVDGQQRLRTIQYFYEGKFEPDRKEFALKGVSDKFTGKTYKTLSEENRRRLDDSTIPATIIRQDEPSDDDSSIYLIFERLNTGGEKLESQEIRACVFHGDFNELLAHLNNNESWRKIYGQKDLRMKDQEQILRFLALYFEGNNYKKTMIEFLNNFMSKNRNLEIYSENQIKEVFFSTIDAAYEYFGEKAFKPKGKFNSAVYDSVMIGLSYRLKKGKVGNKKAVIKAYESLIEDKDFLALTTSRTSGKAVLEQRLKKAISAFSDIE